MHKENGKIKICFVLPKAYLLFNPKIDKVFGGAEVDLYYLSTELAKDQNFDVSFVVADYGQQAIEYIENVKLIKSLTFNENPIAGARKVWNAMKAADANIYFLKTASLGVPLARKFCTMNKRKLVYRTASSIECNGVYRKNKPLIGSFVMRAISLADKVITQNLVDQKMLKDNFGIESAVISNGHRMPHLDNTSSEFVLWCGRSVAIKRSDLFVTLAAQCSNEHFVMICQRATGDYKYDDLKKEADKIENLKFIERVRYQEIDDYFIRAKAFVNTSDSEGFPNTFIQACKAGTPILSLSVNPDGFLDKYKCGICYNGDFVRMQRSIGSLDTVLSSDDNAQMGINARKYVEENHDISKIIDKYKKLFRGIIK